MSKITKAELVDLETRIGQAWRIRLAAMKKRASLGRNPTETGIELILRLQRVSGALVTLLAVFPPSIHVEMDE